MRQQLLSPPGCQLWNTACCASSPGGRFAYCSTLAIYIYGSDYVLEKIIGGFEKTITALCWSPHDGTLLATISGDNCIRVWDIVTERVVRELQTPRLPKVLEWSPHEVGVMATVTSAGEVTMWNWEQSARPVNDVGQIQAQCFRWNPTKRNEWAVGTKTGQILIGASGQRKPRKFSPPQFEETKVAHVQWDPLSDKYLLAANEGGAMVLFDAEAGSVVNVFEKPAGGISAVCFQPGNPGGFVTAGEKTGVIRMWNVSQRASHGLLRPSQTGFQNFAFTGPATATAGKGVPTAVCTFKDGSIGVYNLTKRKWHFRTEQGHTETIFDCAFKPTNCRLLATASYDASIKLWDTETMQCKKSIQGGIEGVLYCVCWAPGDGDRIMVSTSSGNSYIFDVSGEGSGKLLLKLASHVKPSFRCAWNQLDPNLVMSTSSDMSCVVHRLSGSNATEVRKYVHPNKVYGCDWDPFQKTRLATGCQDSVVRLFDTSSSEPVLELTGHRAKVFNVSWSPILEGMLMSGSDDKTIRVWNVDNPTDVKVLTGHTDNVRALVWHTELPYIVLSGSWDSTIRVWDFRTETCLKHIGDHHADVYGLTCHPERPFLFVSSSRDNTLRFWGMDELSTCIKARVLVCDDLLEECQASVSDSMQPSAKPLLAGAASASLAERMAETEDALFKKKHASSFLFSSALTNDLWDLAHTTLTKKSLSVGNQIVHVEDVMQANHGRASELETAHLGRFKGVGGRRKEDALVEAAAIYLRMGNFVKYCEILVQLGKWEKALAVAPAVSNAFWQDLAARYARHLEDDEHVDEALPFYAAAKDVDRFVELVVAAGDLSDAFLVAAADCEGKFQSPETIAMDESAEPSSEAKDARLHSISQVIAERQQTLAQPIRAACTALSTSDSKRAVKCLYSGNETELACAIAVSLNVTGVDEVFEALASRLEVLQEWELALRVLEKMEKPKPAKQFCCARFPGSAQTAAKFYERAGCESPEVYLQKAELASSPADVVRYFALGRDAAQAARRGVAALTGVLSDPEWRVKDAVKLLKPLWSCDLKSVADRQLQAAVQAFSAYVGSVRAVYKGYVSVAPHLVRHVRVLAERAGGLQALFGDTVDRAALDALADAYEAGSAALGVLRSVLCSSDAQDKSPPELQSAVATLRQAVERVPTALREPARHLLAGVEAEVQAGPAGHMSKAFMDSGFTGYCWSEVVPLASDIPSGRTRHETTVSQISGSSIAGPVFKLSNAAYAGLAESIMWARVNPFSPLANGERLNAH